MTMKAEPDYALRERRSLKGKYIRLLHEGILG
jgi:hypothetical protein